MPHGNRIDKKSNQVKTGAIARYAQSDAARFSHLSSHRFCGKITYFPPFLTMR